MPHTVANDDTARDAALGREQGFGLVLVPCVRRVLPAFGGVLDEAGFCTLCELELLPEARADRKLPCVRIRTIDELAARQFHPARLDCAVGPEGVLRGKLDFLWPDALRLPVGVQACVF